MFDAKQKSHTLSFFKLLLYVPLLLFCLNGSQYFCTVILFFIGVVLSNRVVIFAPFTLHYFTSFVCLFYSNGKYFVLLYLTLNNYCLQWM